VGQEVFKRNNMNLSSFAFEAEKHRKIFILQKLRKDLEKNGNIWEKRHSEIVLKNDLFSSFSFPFEHQNGVLLDRCSYNDIVTSANIMEALEDLTYIYLKFAISMFDETDFTQNFIAKQNKYYIKRFLATKFETQNFYQKYLEIEELKGELLSWESMFALFHARFAMEETE